MANPVLKALQLWIVASWWASDSLLHLLSSSPACCRRPEQDFQSELLHLIFADKTHRNEIGNVQPNTMSIVYSNPHKKTAFACLTSFMFLRTTDTGPDLVAGVTCVKEGKYAQRRGGGVAAALGGIWVAGCCRRGCSDRGGHYTGQRQLQHMVWRWYPLKSFSLQQYLVLNWIWI